jgi:hypothetical protein
MTFLDSARTRNADAFERMLLAIAMLTGAFGAGIYVGSLL